LPTRCARQSNRPPARSVRPGTSSSRPG
jgi:hypothetical protein